MIYYSIDEAKEAIRANGKNVYNLPYHLRDDENLAIFAIEHGAPIDALSYRLQNNPSVSLKYAQRCNKLGISERDFFRAILIGCYSLEFINNYCSNYTKNPYFSFISKLSCSKKDNSDLVFSKEDKDKLLDIFEKTYTKSIKELKKDYYSLSYEDLFSKLNGYSSSKIIQSFALLARCENLPFNHISKLIEEHIERLDTKVDVLRSKIGVGSYPERYVDALLKKINITFNREVVFPWSKPNNVNKLDGYKRYDFYLPEQNCIIEVHGAQHYSKGFEIFGGRTLQEEQKNDKTKKSIAQKNGITNYIVINASISNPSYISNSIINNVDFVTMFDVSSVNWSEIHRTAIGEIDKSIPLPLYKLERLYHECIKTFFDSQTNEDGEIAPKKAFGEGCNEETSILKEWKKNLKISSRGLYPHEIILLERAKKSAAPEMQHPVNSDKVIGLWYYEYGISNVRPIIERLEKRGFLQLGSLKSNLLRSNINEIKKFASLHGIKGIRNKEDLVMSILKELPHDIIKKTLPQEFYELTEMGELELIENNYIFEAIKAPVPLSLMNRITIAQQHADKNILEVLQEYAKCKKHHRT